MKSPQGVNLTKLWNQVDHNDLCSACSGAGQLLLCDGCERAFHFTCIDPPIDSQQPPLGEWYCPNCLKSRLEFPAEERGVFTNLTAEVNTKNPSAFHLPIYLRDFYEGVKTGEEGEYEEHAPPRTKFVSPPSCLKMILTVYKNPWRR